MAQTGKQYLKNVANTAKKTTGKKSDDSWKKDLRKAYDAMAKRQIEASDKSYKQAKTSADLQAQSRGMGRSSYNNATLANLDSDKVKAQNNIREDIDAQYAQAVVQRENELWQQHFQEQQAAQQQENWQAQYDLQKQQLEAQLAQANASASVSFAISAPMSRMEV